MSGDGRVAFALVGFGELAGAFAGALAAAGFPAPATFTRPRDDPAGARELEERLRSAPVAAVATLAEAVSGADAVLVCVPSHATRAVAEESVAALRPGTLYADFASAAPEEKAAAAEVVERSGGLYADAAVLGTVAASGAAVPILASGTGAARLAELGGRAGLTVRPFDGPAGAAARVKLLRSVYMKGRDALIAEMLLAARRYDVEELVAASIAGPGEQGPFPALAERTLCSLALHADRRARELDSSARLLEAAGVAPTVTKGALERLRSVAAAGLRGHFGNRRPDSAADVLDVLEQRLDR